MKMRLFHGWHSSEPLGLEYIAAALEIADFTCRFRSVNELEVSLNSSSGTLCFITGFTCEYPALRRIAHNAKARGDTTILGGYHACGTSQLGADQLFDHIVVGEGEKISVDVAKSLLCGERSELGGKSLFHETLPRVLHAGRIADLDKLPTPVRSSDRMGKYLLHDLIWPPLSKQRSTAILLTSRGCVNNCDFCASSTVWGQGVTFRSPANIVAELQDLKTRFGTNTIVIIDQSLGQAKQWTMDVCQAIKDASLGMNWYHQSNVTVDEQVIRAMAEAGCTKIGFGVEGLSPRAVEIVKPPNPKDFDTINSVFDYCTSLGLFTKAYLMLGFPWETDEVIREYFEWLPKLKASQIKISYMTPFPGTRYWDTYSGQLLTRDWAMFDTVSMPVVYNPNVTVDQYERIRGELFRTFYGSPTYAETTQRLLDIRPHYAQSYIEFADYLKAYDMISGDESWLQSLKHSRLKPRATEVA